ncbi:MAG: hypothetical protein AAF490_04360 [Chloroflexota bacterium]
MRPADITTDWVANQLKKNKHFFEGEIVNLVTKRLESHASAAISLEITYSADSMQNAPQRLFCKLYLDDQFWGGKGEYIFYTELAPEMQPFANPVCYASDFDKKNQVCFLLLEDVTITHTLTSGGFLTLKQYQKCIDELVQLHSNWWEHPKLDSRVFTSPLGGPLKMVQALSPQQIFANGQSFIEQLPQLLEQISNGLSQTNRTFCALVGTKWFELFAVRTKGGRQTTMLHGDYHHYGNICLPIDRLERIRILDWETWKRGIGAYDLAYLIAYQDKSDKQFEFELLKYYHQNLVRSGMDYSWEQCLFDYRLSLLGCIFPPLFWSNADALFSAMQICERWDCQALLR